MKIASPKQPVLRIYLWRDFVQNPNGCRWVLRSADGDLLSVGEGVSQLPTASACEVVLEDSLVSCFRITLPRLARRKLLPLLPAALDSLTLTAVEQLHLALMDTPFPPTPPLDAGEEPVESSVWAIDLAWLRGALARLAEQGCVPIRLAPEIALTPWRDRYWNMLPRATGVTLQVGPAHFLHMDSAVQLGTRLAKQAGLPAPAGIRIYQSQNPLGETSSVGWESIAPTDRVTDWDWRRAPWQQQANLLQGIFAPAHAQFDWRRQWRRLGFGLAAIVVLYVMGGLAYWAKLEQEAYALEQQIQSAAQGVLPTGSQIVAPAQQVQAIWRQQRAQQGLNTQDAFLALLTALGKHWPTASEPYTLSWGAQGMGVTLHRSQADHLEAMLLRSTNLQYTRLPGNDPELVEFRIRLKE